MRCYGETVHVRGIRFGRAFVMPGHAQQNVFNICMSTARKTHSRDAFLGIVPTLVIGSVSSDITEPMRERSSAPTWSARATPRPPCARWKRPCTSDFAHCRKLSGDARTGETTRSSFHHRTFAPMSRMS